MHRHSEELASVLEALVREAFQSEPIVAVYAPETLAIVQPHWEDDGIGEVAAAGMATAPG
jgi:hypothetical protein